MKKILFSLFWFLSVGVAYWLGVKDSDTSYLGGEAIHQNERNFQITKSNFPVDAVEQGSIKKEIATDSSKLKVSDSVELFENISEKAVGTTLGPKENLLSSNPLERLQAFTEILKTPDQDSINLALEAYESLPGGPGRFSELKTLAFAWGQVNPQAALAWAKKQQHWDEHVATGSVLDSWVRTDADAAIGWANENFEGKDNPYYVGLIKGLSDVSLPKATDLMTELPYGRIRGRSAHILFEKAWSMGEDMAIHWAENLPEGSLQNFAYGELGEKVAREDMGRAIEWLDSMEESEIKVAVSEDVSREMVRKDSNQAAEWANSLPEGNSKTKAVEEIVKFWAKEDPLQAANWAESLLAGPSKITAMNEVAERWASQDPVATAEWINQIPADANKDPLIETLVNKIHKTDPESALAWAETISSPERRKFMTELVERSVKKEKFSAGR